MIDVTGRFPVLLVWPRLRMIPGWVDAIAVHHTAVDPQAAEPEVGLLFPAAVMSVEDELNHIAVIHLYHKSKGYGGFAYHFISFPSGRCYHVVPLTQWGAHVGGENDHLYGIVAAGNFTNSVPGLPQQRGLADAVQNIDDFLNREVLLKPHRAYGGTTCPGNRWQEWVPQLREQEEEDEMKDLVVKADKSVYGFVGPYRVRVTPEAWLKSLGRLGFTVRRDLTDDEIEAIPLLPVPLSSRQAKVVGKQVLKEGSG